MQLSPALLNYPLTRYLYRPLSRPLAAAVARTPVTPIQLTLLSGAFALAAGVAFGLGAYVAGVGLALVAQITDCADGDLARLSGRTSRSGAFLDSVLDRWTDAALIIGLGFSDLDRLGSVAALALAASLVVSYTRARAQSLGVDCPEGIGTRDARMLVLMVAALFDVVAAGLWTVAILGTVTSIHRAVWTMHVLGQHDRRDAADALRAVKRPL